MKKLLLLGGALLTASPAFAQTTFGDVVSNANDNALGPAADLVLNAAWVVGLLMLMIAAVAFFRSGRQHGQGLEGGKIGALVVGGALLIAFPTYVGVGPASFFGGDADTASIGGELRSLD